MSHDPSEMAGAANLSEDKGGVFKLARRLVSFPLTFILIIAAVTLEILDQRGPIVNYTMIILAIVFLVLETIKVTRVDKGKFLFELIVAVSGVAIATALLTYHLASEGRSPELYHWVILGVLLYDATVTPYLSYSNALRDMSVTEAGHH